MDRFSQAENEMLEEIGRQGERMMLVERFGEARAEEILLSRSLGELTYLTEDEELEYENTRDTFHGACLGPFRFEPKQ